ncbi:MAG: ATP-dependent Clp protease proteolytic subunit [Planctomycetota bacterium]
MSEPRQDRPSLAQEPLISPSVVEKSTEHLTQWDVFSRLLKDRIVFIGNSIDRIVANVVIGQLLFLETDKSKTPINVYVNTPGGAVDAGLAIYDTMRYVHCEVSTICVGLAASLGAVLLAAGKKGKRFALPNAKMLLHQPWTSGLGGAASDIQIHADDLVKTKRRINEILAFHTGQPIEKIEKDTDRDFIMTAEEAREYGLIDEVLEYAPEGEK